MNSSLSLQDRTNIKNNFSQAHSEIEIPESICDGDSFSNTEEELLDCKMVIRFVVLNNAEIILILLFANIINVYVFQNNME